MSAANENGGAEVTPSAPLLRVVSGNPSDEDVAILVAVIGSAGGSSGPDTSPSRDLWGTPADRLRPAEPLAPSAFPNLRFGY